MTSPLDFFEGCGDAEVAVVIDGRENHTPALLAHHLARGKVGNEKDTLAYQLFRLIPLGDTAQDGALFVAAIIKDKLQSFLTFLHLLATLDDTNTNIKLLEILERDDVFHRSSLIGSLFVGF